MKNGICEACLPEVSAYLRHAKFEGLEQGLKPLPIAIQSLRDANQAACTWQTTGTRTRLDVTEDAVWLAFPVPDGTGW